MSDGLITMSQFGRWGRNGNQFFQYAFLKTYAEKYNLELQIPPWVGCHLFGTNDPPVTKSLPAWRENGGGLKQPDPPKGEVLVNRDFRGYAQYHTSYYRPFKQRIRELFEPVSDIRARFLPYLEKFREAPVHIGIHLRRGDYGRAIFPIIPVDWYLRWLEVHFHEFWKGTRLFIATEDDTLLHQFIDYPIDTFETLGGTFINQPMPDCTYLDYDKKHPIASAMDWYPDFYFLSKCNVILGPSSSFSFFAAMLADCEYWRADLDAAGFVKTDPWCANPQLRQHVDDYKYLEGISLNSNPYW